MAFLLKRSQTLKYINREGREYYFCSNQCLDEFTAPEKELRRLKRQVTISIVLTIPIIVLTYTTLLSKVINDFVLLALATPIQFWIGRRFYRGLWDGIKAKASNMDTLIAVGTSAAYFYSAVLAILPSSFPFQKNVYFETAAIIITLILIGRLLESRTKEKASSAVRKLLDLQARMANVIRNGTEVNTPVEEIQENELVIIKTRGYDTCRWKGN